MLLASALPGFPTRVSEWTLGEQLGSGATSRVFLAERRAIGRHAKVAVKLLRPELAASSTAGVELIEEAKLLASLRHPNLTELLEAGQLDGVVYLVLEYVEGTTLAHLLGHARLPDGVVARVITDALRGLHAAHEHRTADGAPASLVHRDFSPQNILLGVDGVTRLTDFGIAKAIGRLSVTRTGIVKGHVRYMSPEQACGEPLDRRSDIWAAGVVLWEALAGRRLIVERGELAALERIVSAEPMPALSSVRPDVPAELDAIVSSALHKDPARRPASAEELRRQLLRAFAELAPIAEPHELGALVREVAATRTTNTTDTTDRADTTDSTDTTDTTESSDLRETTGRSRALPLALGSIALGALVVAAASWMSDAKTTARLNTGLRLPAWALAPPPRADGPSPATLTVIADAPIRSLSIDGLALPVRAPSAELTLAWTPGHDAAKVHAQSLDGRTASARLSPSARTLQIEFDGAATPRAGKRKPPPRSAIGDIRLAPTPYPKR